MCALELSESTLFKAGARRKKKQVTDLFAKKEGAYNIQRAPRLRTFTAQTQRSIFSQSARWVSEIDSTVGEGERSGTTRTSTGADSQPHQFA